MKRALLVLFVLGLAAPTSGCLWVAAGGLGAGYAYETHESRKENKDQEQQNTD